MDTIFKNSENSKTSNPRKLLVNLSVKNKPKRSDKYVILSNLSISYTWQILKSLIKIINSKYFAQSGMKIWMIWCIIFCIIYSKLFWVYHEKTWKSDW